MPKPKISTRKRSQNITKPVVTAKGQPVLAQTNARPLGKDSISQADMIILLAIHEFEVDHAAGSLRVQTLADLSGMSLATLRRHLKSLVVDDYVDLVRMKRDDHRVQLKSRGKVLMKQVLSDEADKVKDVRARISQFIKSNPTYKATIGELAFGKRIGEGGNSLVYSVSDASGQSYAFKIVTEDCSIRETKRFRRFKAELEIISKLSETTSRITRIFDHGWFNVGSAKYPYVVMERYPYTLLSWLKANPIQNMRQLQSVLASILACLAIVHHEKIVHRDLKPENVFVNQDGSVVLADFGIAWFDSNNYNRLTQTSKDSFLGNRLFSSPEQMYKGVKPHATMDLFAIGQLIQWIITGKTHLGVGRKQLATIDSDFAPLDEIVDQLLQNDPSKRPQSVQDVSRILEQAFKRKNFTCVPLRDSGAANFPLSNYKSPPLGERTMYGVPFQIQNARIALTEIFDSGSIILDLGPVFGVHTIHFLINAGDGRKRYAGREIGSIKFIFDGGEISFPPYLVKLGENVREWAIGNSVFDEHGKLEPLVDTVKDNNSREFWLGKTRDGEVAVIDMLTVRLAETDYSKKLIGIEFTRSIPRNTNIGLDYFVSGVTIETG